MAPHWATITSKAAFVCLVSTAILALPNNDQRSARALNPRNLPVSAASPTGTSNQTVTARPSSAMQINTGFQQMAGGVPKTKAVQAETKNSSSSFVGSPGSAFTNHFVLDTADLDLDGDGCIAGEAELDLFKYHVATALMGKADNLLRAHSIVHRSDTNKDGRICWCDFVSIYLHDKDERNEHHHTAPFVVILGKNSGMFSRLDIDRDGKLKGAELNNLIEQFSSCIPEDQARLIVTAMTGLEIRDGAISYQEFARFLGTESNHTAFLPTDVNSSKVLAQPSGYEAPLQKAQSGIAGVLFPKVKPARESHSTAANNKTELN